MSTEVIEQIDISRDYDDTAPQDDSIGRLTYEDQLSVWCLLLQNRLVGQLSPPTTAGTGARAPIVYDLLVPASVAVQELNAVSDISITAKHLPAILKQFRHVDPPYSSFHPTLQKVPKKRGPKTWQQKRVLKQLFMA